MKAGKLSPEKLQQLVLGRFAHRRPDVLVPASLGEDSTVLDFGDEVCIVSTDPITGAGVGAGRLAVHVSCNDVAANGGRPVGVQVVLLLPEQASEEYISTVMDEVEAGCADLNIEVLGGHTEITSKVAAPIIVTTAIGRAPKDKYVTSGGSQVGDDVIVTKSLGLEGASILATDWEKRITESSQEIGDIEAILERARGFGTQISAVRDGVLAAGFGVSAMHDVTEGGLYGGLWEMGKASGLAFRINRRDVPVRPETAAICESLSLDPLGLISSGAMLITCRNGSELVAHLASHEVQATVIGKTVAQTETVLVDGEGVETTLSFPPEDELWRFLSGQEAKF